MLYDNKKEEHLKPSVKPENPRFSSGPCPKRPGWSPAVLDQALLGRSHRSEAGKKKLAEAIDRTRDLLQLPEDYRVGIVPASDTGAMEIALWSLLGERGVEMLAWESFGLGWINDVVHQLRLKTVTQRIAAYGELPDLNEVNFDHDVIFTWNGTTSGVRVPNGDWIPDDRKGLTLCDATSAVFAMELPWRKLDVATYSWQKVLGGEAAHGMLILGPRAVERLESWTPPWPMPKLFRLTREGKLNENIFRGATINTPSMLCVEDYLDALKWVQEMGGLSGLINRVQRNFRVLEAWIEKTPWVDFLAVDAASRSPTSVCLKVIDPWFTEKSLQQQAEITKKIVTLLEREEVAFDIGSYRDAPPGLRIWCGATVETPDIEALLPWLDWAFSNVREG